MTEQEAQADRLRAIVHKWAQPPIEMIDTLPRGNTRLSYLGHAATTGVLCEVDPFWTWEPVAMSDAGEPLIHVRGEQARMWIRLTVLGVTRLGVGTCAANKSDVEKELIGDAIRNAAMRFGVALNLWSKADAFVHDPEPESLKVPAKKPAPKKPPADKPDPSVVDALALRLAALSKEELDAYTEWRHLADIPPLKQGLTVEQLEEILLWLDDSEAVEA